MDESRNALILRGILMTCLVVSSWSFGRAMIFLSFGPESSGFLEQYAYLFWMFYGPILAGLYAGSTLRTIRSVLYVLLGTAAVSAFYFGFVDRLDSYLGEMIFSTGGHFLIFIIFLGIGAISAVVIRRLRIWWRHVATSIYN